MLECSERDEEACRVLAMLENSPSSGDLAAAVREVGSPLSSTSSKPERSTGSRDEVPPLVPGMELPFVQLVDACLSGDRLVARPLGV